MTLRTAAAILPTSPDGGPLARSSPDAGSRVRPSLPVVLLLDEARPSIPPPAGDRASRDAVTGP